MHFPAIMQLAAIMHFPAPIGVAAHGALTRGISRLPSAFCSVMSHQPSRAERLRSAADRDGEQCVWCRRPCTGLVHATTDHLVPKVKGGPSWLENEVVACGRCNRERGHLSPADWLVECLRRGWEPDVDAVERALTALHEAIGERGGQRRARPYLAAQRRRLARVSRSAA